MTGVQIRETMRMVEQALEDARDAERWAQAGLHDDKDGTHHRSWIAAQKTARELERIIQRLRSYAMS